MKIITCAGYGATGSSAITDLISEYDNVFSLGAQIEFQILSEPHGFFELENAVVSGNGLLIDIALSEFINFYQDFKLRFSILKTKEIDIYLEEFFQDINVISWSGGWYGSTSLQSFLSIMAKISYEKELKKTTYMGYEPETTPWIPTYYPYTIQRYAYCSREQYHKAVKKYLNSLFKYLTKGVEKDILMVDHLVPPTDIEIYAEYFDDLKVVCVDRDPIDLFLLNELVWGERWIPTDDVDTYIKWFKLTRERKSSSNHILYVKFEDLVLEYEKTVERIENFLSIDKTQHVNKYVNFDPKKSFTNLALEQKYELSDELQWKVKKIKNELVSYCYNFPDYKLVDKQSVIATKMIQREADKIVTNKKIKPLILCKSVVCYLKYAIKNYLKSFCKIKSKEDIKKHLIKVPIIIIYFPIYFVFNLINSIIRFVINGKDEAL